MLFRLWKSEAHTFQETKERDIALTFFSETSRRRGKNKKKPKGRNYSDSTLYQYARYYLKLAKPKKGQNIQIPIEKFSSADKKVFDLFVKKLKIKKQRR